MEDHLSDGWTHQVEVEVDASAELARHWIPRSLGRVVPIDDDHCRLVGSTDEPYWYAHQLTALPASFRIVGPPEVQEAARRIGRNLLRAGGVEAPG